MTGGNQGLCEKWIYPPALVVARVPIVRMHDCTVRFLPCVKALARLHGGDAVSKVLQTCESPALVRLTVVRPEVDTPLSIMEPRIQAVARFWGADDEAIVELADHPALVAATVPLAPAVNLPRLLLGLI